MNANRHATFVSTDWLHAQLDAPDVKVVDASWFLPTDSRDPRAEFAAGHVPGAVFFDIDGIADRSTDLPHMLPDEATFAAAVGALGIGDGDRVVCYDGYGVYSAPRAWWTFRAFGHDGVTVLEGGLPRWRAEGRPLATGDERRAPARFTARLDPTLAVARSTVHENVAAPRFQLVDVRPAGRFRGDDPEPRPGLRRGHVPGSRNVPWPTLLDVDGAALLPAADLRAVLASAGVDLARPMVATCGSGLTAALLAIALDVLGAAPTPIYDGSWAEWGAIADAPVATGPADAPERTGA